MAHVEAGRQVRLNHLVPLLESHLMHGAIAGDSGVVDQHFDLADIVLDFRHSGLAGIVIPDIKFVGRNTGVLGELVRLFLVARISCDHGIASVLQRQADRFADSTATACY